MLQAWSEFGRRTGVATLVAACLFVAACAPGAVSSTSAPMSGSAASASVDPKVAADLVRNPHVHSMASARGDAAVATVPVHGHDVSDVVWRTALLTALSILSLLAFGIWAGIGERSYLYLSLALLAQLVCMASSGGELARLPWIGPLIGDNPRTPSVAALAALLAGFVFMAHYLDMDTRHARMARIVRRCNFALLALLALMLLTGVSALMWAAGAVVAVATVAVLIASVEGLREGQRPAGFLLLSWLPMLGVLALYAGEALGLWMPPAWAHHAVHAGPAMSGLLLTIGLTDTLQQMRRDRDHASRMATFDALTGALSRPVVEARLNTLVVQAHESGRPLSLVFFDIDRFKAVNDDHGHRVGDGCLRIIALRTRNRLRTYDVFGRWGGDELLVILPDTRLGEALGVAENLRSAVNCRPLSIDGTLFDASLSLGVAELAAGESAEHLLERADAALYASKSAGRDRVTGQAHPRFVDPEAGARRGNGDRPQRGKPDGTGRGPAQ